MAESIQDMWSQWLLHRRFAGDPQRMKALIDFLYPVRDQVLNHANLGEGEILLDVGCGDGLIAFGALDQIKTSHVIFSDISQDLLNHTQNLARQMQVMNRCEFLCASADDLSAIRDAAVDVVTTRSVLIYVAAKQQAFSEFLRVLRPKGRLSIFEPINRFCYPEPPGLFWGYDVAPVRALADKIKAVYLQLQPPDRDPMLDFDERDLIAFAEKAGFNEIHLDLQAEISLPMDANWESFMQTAGNPRIPPLEEAMQQALTPEEREAFVAHLRPLVETKKGTSRSAVAYLWAVKD
ncbi:MAG: methyltransferase domain-containing protein [Chloroflexi bacterium]|nr:methyltransferase domain-containing protein [Chloroflexota bacterium]